MSATTRRSLLMLILMIVAGVGLVLVRPELLPFYRSAAANTWVVDIDNWRRTPYERIVSSPFDLSVDADLESIPMRIGEWTGVDTPVTNVEVFILLEPEQLVQRRYALPDGRYVWLTLLASRKMRSFHPTEMCYIADGWQTNLDSVEVPLQRGSLRALRVRARKGEWEHLVLYFYVWPNTARDLAQGIVMFKVTSPPWGDEATTQALAEDFIREFFWEVVQ